MNKSCTSSETSTEQAVVPSINYINNTNSSNYKNVSNLENHTKNFEENENDFVISTIGEITSQEKKLREKKKGFVEPNLNEVKTYFQENNFPELEAQKFFNYFSSVGWLVGGKIPMIDWQAAAQNWIINSVNFNHNTDTTPTNRPKHLNTSTDKNYAEPL